MVKKLEGAGLRGQVAGETSLCTVGQEEGLAYRGHKIETLAEKGTFEEVAYLLFYGKLPNQSELDSYKELLKGQRDLPQELKDVLKKPLLFQWIFRNTLAGNAVIIHAIRLCFDECLS